MHLREYQQKVLERFEGFLGVLREKYNEAREIYEFLLSKGKKAALGEYCAPAWQAFAEQGLIPHVQDAQGRATVPPWIARTDGVRRAIPHLCFKVPTGGGKTLLGAHAVGMLQSQWLERQTGFVLWIVPSDAIYKQTWKQLADKQSPYRQVLERASGGRVRLLEKDDHFTRHDTENHLCVMLLMLQSSNRQTKETLRMFRDAGGYSSFFPEVDDPLANEALKAAVPNLDERDFAEGRDTLATVDLKHSLGNALRLLRPLVVMDEGHKAYTPTARDTLCGFNPSFILELSATPNSSGKAGRVSNVLVSVPGTDLKQEEMIKLPIRVTCGGRGTDWRDTLAAAHKTLTDLGGAAERLLKEENRYIRPIMLVRVERTGEDQRDSGHVHAEDVRTQLQDRLGVRPEEIRVKSADKDELEDTDLLAPECPVRYIITKNALQEGWDCPFAYVLAALDTTSAKTALTQMIGRILRQPGARRTSIPELNECYIHCHDQNVEVAAQAVKAGLESEGMGDLGAEVTGGKQGESNGALQPKVIPRKEKFRNVSLFLPRVLSRAAHGALVSMDYEQAILARIPWREMRFSRLGSFQPGQESTIEEIYLTQDLAATADGGVEVQVTRTVRELETAGQLDFGFLVRQLVDTIPNPWEAARVLEEVIEDLRGRGYTDRQIHVQRLGVVKAVREDFQKQVEARAEAIFLDGLRDGSIQFELVSENDPMLNWELAKELRLMVDEERDEVLRHRNGNPLDRHLFEETYAKEFNGLEKDMALYLDQQKTLKWWHRLAARQDYYVQGWQKRRVYPDFLVAMEREEGQPPRIMLLETKGDQLKGNDDTTYKRRLFEVLEQHNARVLEAGKVALGHGEVEMVFNMVIEDQWRADRATAIRWVESGQL